jgi:flagellar basal-body rod protein FlgF
LDNATYVGLSRQMTLRRELDIVANNVANSDTAGFKIESLMTGTEQRRPAKDAMLPHAVRFVLDTGVARDFSQGALRRTDNDLDVAIEGDAFLTIQTANGERYTRDGRLRIDAGGQMVTQTGDPVLGEGGEPLTLRVDGPSPSIASDGTISQATCWSAGSASCVSTISRRSPRRATAAFWPTGSNPSPRPTPRCARACWRAATPSRCSRS